MKAGHKVVFAFPKNGRDYDQEQTKKFLKVGETYTIEELDVGSWHTNVLLKEVPEVWFNSVMFKDA